MVKITKKISNELVNEIQITTDVSVAPLVDKAIRYLETFTRTIDVKTKRDVIKTIPIHAIYSFEKGDEQKLYCVAGDDTQYISMFSLQDFANQFGEYPFIAQINRQTFINLYKIASFEKSGNARIKVTMENGDLHIINRSYVSAFIAKFRRI